MRKSRPSRARGLKRLANPPVEEVEESRPSRARGLKQLLLSFGNEFLQSRPSRARGLKPVLSDEDLTNFSRVPRGRAD